MTDTALSDQIPLALLSTYALQFVKNSRWFPWLTVESQKLNRIAGVVIAFATSLGILMNFDHAAGILTISGLTGANLLHAGARFIQQYAFQQVAYKTVVAPPLPGALQAGAAEKPPVLKIEPPAGDAK
jgi:hypothetical protein